MQLTRAADYAVRVMIHLAGLPPATRASRDELAQAAECPEQFLSKVLQGLARAGLIVSHRGNTGGFELPTNQRSATIFAVVEAIEGPLHLNVCLASDNACARQTWCPAHTVWADVQEAMTKVLKAATIDDLARRAAVSRSLSGPPLENPRWN
ncbi:MAG TPA: Rrf2 family transcriptional regulator [Bryobacteraceae bacterium]|nr:Rrf2 family transcriptional regulator [Bryobacteraceae bacterium]